MLEMYDTLRLSVCHKGTLKCNLITLFDTNYCVDNLYNYCVFVVVLVVFN